jgi:hypothetical protein
MKKKKSNSYVSNNPMLDGVSQVELPIIGAEAYDAPLSYTRTESHAKRSSGDGMHKIKYPTVGSVDTYDAPPVVLDGKIKKDEKNKKMP